MAYASLLSGSHAGLLQLAQWAETDADGQVRGGALRAQVRAPGSTEAGLLAAWGPALDRAPAAPFAGVSPLPWADPWARSASASGRTGGSFVAAGSDAPARGGAPSGSQLLALAARHFEQQAAPLAARVAQSLQSEGLAEGWFSYRQTLQLAGQARTLVWVLHASASGHWFSSQPVLESATANTLQIRYTSRAAQSGLPVGYAYREGGWLRWTLLDTSGNPVAAAVQRDTGGIFDGPSGLACLLAAPGAGAGCAGGAPDARALMEHYGTEHAELSYVDALRPIHAVSAQGSRYALVRLEVVRTLESLDPACRSAPLRYVNDFRAAFPLEARVARYTFNAGAQWTPMPPMQLQLQTALVPWRKLALAIRPADLSGLDAEVIDPDTGQLTPLSTFPPGLQTVHAGAIVCRSNRD